MLVNYTTEDSTSYGSRTRTVFRTSCTFHVKLVVGNIMLVFRSYSRAFATTYFEIETLLYRLDGRLRFMLFKLCYYRYSPQKFCTYSHTNGRFRINSYSFQGLGSPKMKKTVENPYTVFRDPRCTLYGITSAIP